MKTIVLSERSRDPLVHVETPLGIVNIRTGLRDDKGRRVVSVELLPNRYAGEPEVALSGLGNTRLVEATEEAPVEETRTWTFNPQQETTLIAALALAAQQYAHPEAVVDVLDVVNPAAAASLRESLAARA